MIALIGQTASGKSDLALELAHHYDAKILSLDSLSIYKEIDIASAKPSKEQLKAIEHFGIDTYYPNELFNAKVFESLYNEAKDKSKRLIIVGGTGFYLKSLLTGLSDELIIDASVSLKTDLILEDVAKAYQLLSEVDSRYASKITHNDKFRIKKGLDIYFQSGMSLSEYFERNQPKPVIPHIDIYEIEAEKSLIDSRIALRTTNMIEGGLIDEVAYLVGKYGLTPKAFKAIGIAETIEHLEGRFDVQTLQAKITQNTIALAKRQRTFNRTQFENVVRLPLLELKQHLMERVWR